LRITIAGVTTSAKEVTPTTHRSYSVLSGLALTRHCLIKRCLSLASLAFGTNYFLLCGFIRLLRFEQAVLGLL
jgi:hypothetical protein